MNVVERLVMEMFVRMCAVQELPRLSLVSRQSRDIVSDEWKRRRKVYESDGLIAANVKFVYADPDDVWISATEAKNEWKLTDEDLDEMPYHVFMHETNWTACRLFCLFNVEMAARCKNAGRLPTTVS